MKKEVKIVYCYDENKNATYYSKTKKGEKYYCIDCGADLICKDGSKKIKHLAHKNTEECGGTGESIFHKHWKENLFKAGMFINIANSMSEPDNVEILDLFNEISLNKRYNKNWEKEIIVDTLLVTEKGDVIVEINYKNPKDWEMLKPYYDELKLLRVYEVTVDKNVNTRLEWFCLGEAEELEILQQKRLAEVKQQRIAELERQKEKERVKEERKKERAILKKKAEEDEERKWKESFRLGKKLKVFYNYKTKLKKIDKNNYILSCLSENGVGKYEKVNLKLSQKSMRCKTDQLKSIFYTSSGIKYCFVIVNDTPSIDNCYQVLHSSETYVEEYNKYLYAQLCNVS